MWKPRRLICVSFERQRQPWFGNHRWNSSKNSTPKPYESCPHRAPAALATMKQFQICSNGSRATNKQPASNQQATNHYKLELQSKCHVNNQWTEHMTVTDSSVKSVDFWDPSQFCHRWNISESRSPGIKPYWKSVKNPMEPMVFKCSISYIIYIYIYMCVCISISGSEIYCLWFRFAKMRRFQTILLDLGPSDHRAVGLSRARQRFNVWRRLCSVAERRRLDLEKPIPRTLRTARHHLDLAKHKQDQYVIINWYRGISTRFTTSTAQGGGGSFKTIPLQIYQVTSGQALCSTTRSRFYRTPGFWGSRGVSFGA